MDLNSAAFAPEVFTVLCDINKDKIKHLFTADVPKKEPGAKPKNKYAMKYGAKANQATEPPPELAAAKTIQEIDSHQVA